MQYQFPMSFSLAVRLKRLFTFKMRVFLIAGLCVGFFITTVISRNLDDLHNVRSFGLLTNTLGQRNNANLQTLRLVQVLFRHGDRTPIDRFPKDPYDSRKFWPEGFGRLTKRGKLMQYELGQYIRLRYNGFINETYTPEEIYVQSSNYDRTIMSAMANLAGMWPSKDLEFPEGGRQQFVPVHVISSQIDNKIAFSKPCPRYAQISKEIQTQQSEVLFNNEHADLYKYLSEHTGLEVKSYSNVSDIYDTLFVQTAHNLTLPEWTKEVFPDKLRPMAHKWIKMQTHTPEMRRLKAGPLLTDILRNMKRASEKPSEAELKVLEALFHTPAAKFFMYSGHDTTITALLDALDLYSGVIPPYASSLYFELHELPQPIGYTVKIFYRAGLENPATELHLKGCGSGPCKLEDFEKSLRDFIIDEKEWETECNLK
ncbi:Lysosomal acid phosphatase [Orchesella cincta]|uniref:acid phosphatase n=1 Tax=Orchesella cincta TaxID=48709 RepID=A0A1D2N6X9_ORCCI|nr:Lysosomal acid phosphatase [Orchesella cincta]